MLTNLEICLIIILDNILSFYYNHSNGDKLMKAKRSILKTLAVASITFFTATTSFAHSTHDHSTVPFKWQFSKKLYSKVERNLNGTKPTGVIGLNPFEQKKFNHYGIKVGNKFSGIVRNIDVIFERTSAGIKVVGASIHDTSSNNKFLPLAKDSNVSKISMKKTSHAGHAHKRIHVKWSFGDSTNSKIVKHLYKNNEKLSIGLTHLEQNLLSEYGIECGNKFELSISGNSFLVEKTSGGLNILNHIENMNLVKADISKNKAKENI